MRRAQNSFLFPFSAALLACVLAACGGGGGGSSTTPPVGAGSGGSGTGGSVTTQGTATASIAVSLEQYAPVQASATKRRAAFLSPATSQISLTLVSVNGVAQTGSTQTFPIGPNATNCSSVNGIVTCALSMTLPIGTDVLSASTLDASNHSLGTSQIAATIVANASNRVTLAVGGTIASLEIFLSNRSFTPGAPATANVIVVPLDASGAAIVNPGNYNPPITLAATAGGGHFSLITNGTNTGLAATINSPNDQVVLAYDGGGTSGSTTITASAGSPVTPVSKTASYAIAGLSASPSGAQFTSISSYLFSTAGQTGTIAVSGGTPPYTIASSDTSLVTVGGTSPSFTATAVGYGTNGSATITITDSASATTTIPVTFIASPITLAVSTCGSGNTCAIFTGGSSGSSTYTAPQNGTSVNVNPTVITASGGTGTFSYALVSTGTTTGVYATVTQAGSQFTIQPAGNGSEGVIILSGNQTAYFGSVAASGTPAYTIGSTFLAYPTSAHAITLAKNSTSAGQATIALSTSGAPWTINNTCSGVANVTDLNNSVVVQAVASSGTCVVTFNPATGAVPTNLTITAVPDISLSPSTLTLHAPGETGTITINNPAAVTLGNISESSGGSVITLDSYSAGTLTVTAGSTGVAKIKIFDTLLDQDISAAVNVDDAFQQALPGSIGLIGGTPYAKTINYPISSGYVAFGSVNGFVVTPGNPGQISVNPLAGTSGHGALYIVDSAGGTGAIEFTVYSFTPTTHPGSAIGASATVGFSAVGQTDTVAVAGPSGSIGVLNSAPNVVSYSVVGQNIGLTALAPGTATFTVNDLSNGNASATFTVSVTTTTIPIAGHARTP